MSRLALDFTAEELLLLAALASDQLFRREFIDPKMPGYKGDPAEVAVGKSLVARLREIAGHVPPGDRSPSGEANGNLLRNSSKRCTGVRNAI